MNVDRGRLSRDNLGAYLGGRITHKTVTQYQQHRTTLHIRKLDGETWQGTGDPLPLSYPFIGISLDPVTKNLPVTASFTPTYPPITTSTFTVGSYTLLTVTAKGGTAALGRLRARLDTVSASDVCLRI